MGTCPPGNASPSLRTPRSFRWRRSAGPSSAFRPTPKRARPGVARLEAQQLDGVRFVFVPEVAREDVELDTHLSEHLLQQAFEQSAPTRRSVTSSRPRHLRTSRETPPLGELIDSLGLRDRLTPILDWTTHGMAKSLPGHPLFPLPSPGAGLPPYLDHTIDVVIVDDAERLDEAARVAASGRAGQFRGRRWSDSDGDTPHTRGARPWNRACPDPCRDRCRRRVARAPDGRRDPPAPRSRSELRRSRPPRSSRQPRRSSWWPKRGVLRFLAASRQPSASWLQTSGWAESL